MDLDRVVNEEEYVGLFELAVHARPIDVPTYRPRSIAVVLDGSNQDATVRAFAAAMAQTTGAKVAETTSAQSAAEIVPFVQSQNADLLVLPVPFGLDIGKLKGESLGSVVDMVLLESPAPVFCVRQILDAEAATAALSNVLLPISTHAAPYANAAGWAFAMLRPEGRLTVWAIADQDALDEARKLLGDETAPELWKPDMLSRALKDDVAGLIAGAQRRAGESKANLKVEVAYGRPVEIVLPIANRQPSLIVAACERSHSSPSFHLATDMLLGATGPVLVVGSP